jgi:hypothetical protein
MQDQDKRNSNKGGKLAKPMTVGISFSIRKHRPANGTRPCRAKDATDFLKKVSPFLQIPLYQALMLTSLGPSKS